MIGDLLVKLQGKRTYIVAVLLSALAVIWNLDLYFHDNPATPDVKETTWLSLQWYEGIKLLLEGGGLAALRAAFVKK